MRNAFQKCAALTTKVLGSTWAFALALLIVLVWAACGPLFHYSETWQLVINTGTTIITFLMVFLIQNTQNRDTAAMHIKLDEIIRVLGKARNSLMNIEGMSEEELREFQEEFTNLAKLTPTKK